MNKLDTMGYTNDLHGALLAKNGPVQYIVGECNISRLIWRKFTSTCKVQ